MSTGTKRSTPQSLLKSKVFVRSNRGKVSKVVREVYLRNDIPCSSNLCHQCQITAPKDSQGTALKPVLSARPNSRKLQTGQRDIGGHYLIPDTNVFYHCLDVMELTSSGDEEAGLFYDVIVLQTALDELRNKSLPLYNRLRTLIKDGTKRFYVFHNEFHQETFVDRQAGENINDRNDRAIRVATAWYAKHLRQVTTGSKSATPEIILLTDDRRNREKAKEEGLISLSVSQYLADLPNANQLLDMVAVNTEKYSSQTSKEGTGGAHGKENVYADYLHYSRLEAGVKKGELHQGIFNVSAYNSLEATVPCPAFDRAVYVIGRENINRAIQGDLVVLEILPQSEWKMPTQTLQNENEGVVNAADDEEGENAILELEPQTKNRVTVTKNANSVQVEALRAAKVVGIIKRNWRPYVGHIDPSSVSSSTSARSDQITGSRNTTTVFLLPQDRRIPKIRIRTRQAPDLVGKKIVVSIDKWERTSRYPEGHFVKALGAVESKEAETEALLMEWDVQYRPFPKAVLDCLPAEGAQWTTTSQSKEDGTWENRTDLRHLLICSIDPPNCQDIDDALHAIKLTNGNYQVGVHIADVSSFVKADTAMDDEAAARGTTVYMVDKRIDMLPHLLGTNLCSLMPYVERFAFSTIWEITEDAEIVNVQFMKSVIKSREAFSYDAAQLRIDDVNAVDTLTQGMRFLLHLSKKLRQKRLDAGALNLASPEVKIEMDSETSDPIDVQNKEARETNSLVEEFMLLANISVARKIYDSYPETAMLRRHGAPPASNFEILQDILRVRKNLTLHVDSSRQLADSLDMCTDPEEPFFNTLVRIMATRCMLSAEYFGSGQFSRNEFRHYGLATDIYTHFTSPIRRYADVIAHRQLSSAIGFETLHPSLTNQTKLETISRNINYRHRMAQMAGRASVEYYVGQALKNKQDVVEDAFVMKVFNNGFVVFVAKFGIEGIIHTNTLGDDNHSLIEPPALFEPEKYQLTVWPNSEKALRIAVFEKLRVSIKTIQENSTGKRKVEMSLIM